MCVSVVPPAKVRRVLPVFGVCMYVKYYTFQLSGVFFLNDHTQPGSHSRRR